jgi:hypothetical protein
MSTLRIPIGRRVLLLVVVFLPLSIVTGSAAPRDETLGRWQAVRSWRAYSAKFEHMAIRDGRRLYRGPRGLDHVWPYLLAANDSERQAGFGCEVEVSNLHRLLEPVFTPEAAREVILLMSGGHVVPDAKVFEEMRRAAEGLKPKAKHWAIRIESDAPIHFGLHAERSGKGIRGRVLLLTSSGDGALNIVEETWTFPSNGAYVRERKIYVEGPPQSWQTSGGDIGAAGAQSDDSATREREARDEVFRFRLRMTSVLARRRSFEGVRSEYRKSRTVAELRKRIGEPDLLVDARPTLYVYGTDDGNAFVVAAQTDDSRPIYARRVRRSDDGQPNYADVVEDLTSR